MRVDVINREFSLNGTQKQAKECFSRGGNKIIKCPSDKKEDM